MNGNEWQKIKLANGPLHHAKCVVLVDVTYKLIAPYVASLSWH